MKLETFFEKFDRFAEAPDAVMKMRGLILRLAMQGKLSDRHETDRPVSELLHEVEKKKMRLGLESLAKSTGGNSDFSDDETGDEIPARWNWMRFGKIAHHNAGKTLDKGRNRGELRDYITTSNLYWGFFRLDSLRQMPIQDDELERCTAIKGDLLICEGGEAGRAAVWPHDHEICFQNHVHRARFFTAINPYFVQRYFEKLSATGEIEKYRKGVGISNMSGKALASIPIPLPPLAEQKRIVAKVDELMTLCDRLEEQQRERERKHVALARASLTRFEESATVANLNYLFHKSYDIAPTDLRRSILTLAVHGKLVPQDPNDEPAETLLAKIQKRRSELQSASRIPKPESRFSQVDGCEETLPYAWKQVRIGDLCLSIVPQRDKPLSFTGDIPWVSLPLFKENSLSLELDPDCRGLSLDEVEKYRLRIVPAGSVLMSCIGRFGLVALLDRDVIPNQQIHGFYFPTEFLDGHFLCYSLMEQKTFLEAHSTTTTIAYLNKTKCESVPIALPPLAEQKRIVAKLKQLMALVDELEAQLATSEAAAAKLMEAVVAELTAQGSTVAASPRKSPAALEFHGAG